METLRQHLLARCVDFDLHDVQIDEEGNVATFLLFAHGTGKFTGYQQYRPGAPKTREGKGMDPKDLRYFTHTVPGELAFFGTESLDRPGPVYLVEGIFDAVKLHALGLACIAVLGNNPVPLAAMFKAFGRKVIGVLDNDEAGRKLGKFCDEVFVCPEHDPGDMALIELKRLLKL